MDKHAALQAKWDEYNTVIGQLEEQKQWAMENKQYVLSHAYSAAQSVLLGELNMLNIARACYS